MDIILSERRDLKIEDILALYRANNWGAAQRPRELQLALQNAHSLVTAWEKTRLVGLGNAITDGYLVVYYPHLLVHPDYQGQGIGGRILRKMQEQYHNFHMQILVADGKAIDFYQKYGFQKANNTQAMWIYAGEEH
ncbi:MAG: GNAT family N-acetyltransferase [Bacteroidota bacterium]